MNLIFEASEVNTYHDQLEVHWDPQKDTFTFAVTANNDVRSKVADINLDWMQISKLIKAIDKTTCDEE